MDRILSYFIYFLTFLCYLQTFAATILLGIYHGMKDAGLVDEDEKDSDQQNEPKDEDHE